MAKLFQFWLKQRSNLDLDQELVGGGLKGTLEGSLTSRRPQMHLYAMYSAVAVAWQ